MNTNYVLTSSGNGYSEKTNTVFINQRQAVGTIKSMVDEKIQHIIDNGDTCWRCGKNRPYNPGNLQPCPHCE